MTKKTQSWSDWVAGFGSGTDKVAGSGSIVGIDSDSGSAVGSGYFSAMGSG